MSRGLPMEESDEELSGSENAAISEYDDASFDDDMEALRRACTITGADFDSITATATATGRRSALSDSDDEIDDLELVRSIQDRFSMANDLANPLSLEPLATVLPANLEDDDEDDFATFHAIQRRFGDHDPHSSDKCNNSSLQNFEKVNRPDDALDEENFHCTSVDKSKYSKVFPHEEDACGDSLLIQNNEKQSPSSIEWHQRDGHTSSTVPLKDTTFSRAAQVFIDAIKKNRSCQKFLRSKLIQIEARIEEIKKVKERVKILKDFQVSCRKRTGRALSQKKDLRAQLISARRNPNNAKVNEKQISAMMYGPLENSHVARYRDALALFPLSFNRNKWSKLESENLQKGIKQQFQEMALQISIDRMSAADGDSQCFENMLATIKDLEITPERIREFLPKVNWNQLASMYLRNRSGEECEARWLNWEDPLINHEKWTREEEKLLLHIIQEKGINNWVGIAVSLGTNRTPFQCLARYQRSLNACNLRGDWTSDEDAQLRAAVETFGEHNWQAVASVMEGRTGTQCSNRWKQTLHPDRKRVSSWSAEEDQRLRVAVTLFGARNWKKLAQFVPGRTQIQCRERWVNSLDPSVNWNEWTSEEDSRLEAAIAEHGYQWSKVAACVGHRTDNQCRRRWKRLFPDEVPLLRATKEIQKVALIRNFVDREAERPALGASDFVALLPMYSTSEQRHKNTKLKEKKKSRRKLRQEKDKDAGCCVLERMKSKTARKDGQDNPEQPLGTANCRKAKAVGNHNHRSISKKRMRPQGRVLRCRKRARVDANVAGVPHEKCLKRTREDGKHGPGQVSKEIHFDGAEPAGNNVTPAEHAITREPLCSQKSSEKAKDQLCSQPDPMASFLTNVGTAGTPVGISWVPRKMRSKRTREGQWCFKKSQPSGQERCGVNPEGNMGVVLDKGSAGAQAACFPKKLTRLGKDEHITSNHNLARVSCSENNKLAKDSISLRKRKMMMPQSGKHRHSEDADDCIVAELDSMPFSTDDHENTEIFGPRDIIEKDKAHVYLDGDRNMCQGETCQTLASQPLTMKKQKKRRSTKTPNSAFKHSVLEEMYDDEELLINLVNSNSKRRVLKKSPTARLSKERLGCSQDSNRISSQSEDQKWLNTESGSCFGDRPGGPKSGLKQPLKKDRAVEARSLCNDFSGGNDLLSDEKGLETVDVDKMGRKRAVDDEEKSISSLGPSPSCKMMNGAKEEDDDDDDVTLAYLWRSNTKKKRRLACKNVKRDID